MSAPDAGSDDSGEFPETDAAEQKRPVLKTKLGPVTGDTERDTLPPATSRHFPDKDETAGLVSLLFHAQQAVQSAFRFIDEARDANDEELALFLEDAQREGMARVEQAKKLLLARLQDGEGSGAPSEIHEARHGRVHYVSIPDEAPQAAASTVAAR